MSNLPSQSPLTKMRSLFNRNLSSRQPRYYKCQNKKAKLIMYSSSLKSLRTIKLLSKILSSIMKKLSSRKYWKTRRPLCRTSYHSKQSQIQNSSSKITYLKPTKNKISWLFCSISAKPPNNGFRPSIIPANWFAKIPPQAKSLPCITINQITRSNWPKN